MPLPARNPALAQKIRQMRLSIAPIVNVSTGIPPTPFPPTMLHLFLLTEPELDAMAAYYSQTTPTPTGTTNPMHSTCSSPSLSNFRYAYPQTMDWNRPILSTDPSLPPNCKLTDVERLKVKMRMFARFIGMRGAETPRWECERSVELLRNKIAWRVGLEEALEARSKVFRGPGAWQS